MICGRPAVALVFGTFRQLLPRVHGKPMSVATGPVFNPYEWLAYRIQLALSSSSLFAAKLCV